ncbi:MAG TPA: hypothetical protein PKH07_03145 [bacterium]|nr:hypothetical protein [bacterium]
MRKEPVIVSLLIVVSLFFAEPVCARDFRVSRIPNAGVFLCGTCHLNPVSPGARNPFGQTVEELLPSLDEDFWGADLAAGDSDADGFTNGFELQDPFGTWRPGNPNPGNSSLVTNPGDASSFPLVSPTPTPSSTPLPDFTDTPTPVPTDTESPTQTPPEPTATETPTETPVEPTATDTPVEPTVTPRSPDLNGDGVVDQQDLYILMEQWHSEL